jgi:hypothetical protein
VPEHKQQSAKVTASFRLSPVDLDQAFNLAPGEMLPVAVSVGAAKVLLPYGLTLAAPCFRFSARSLFCREFTLPNARETLPVGQGASALSTKCSILSREAPDGGNGPPCQRPLLSPSAEFRRVS